MEVRTTARLSLLVGVYLACTAILGCIPSAIGVAAAASGGGSQTSPPTAALTGLVLSAGDLVPTFDSSVTTYSASVGFLSSQVRVNTSVASAGLAIAVNGLAVGPGQSSTPITLDTTSNAISVTVDNGAGDVRTYTVTVTRAPFSSLAQDGPLLKSVAPHVDDFLGWSVAIDGNTLVVGAPGEDGVARDTAGNPSIVSTATSSSGAVYVFRRASVGSSWLFEAYLKASNNFPNPPAVGDGFGSSLAISGGTLAVGAPGEDSAGVGVNSAGTDDSAPDSGAVYVFQRSGTSWTQQAYIKASNTDSFDLFGFSLALQSDTLVVGAPLEDNIDGSQNNGPSGLGTNAGAAYVFTSSGATWSQQAYLKAGGSLPAQVGDGLGQAVAISGDTLVVTATGEDSTVAESGAAYVFHRQGGIWQQQAALKASNAGLQDLLGTSVSIDGDRLVVGVVGEDSGATGVGGDANDNSLPDAGAAYVFVRNGTTWTQEAYLKASNPSTVAAFGQSVVVRGDLLAVGAYLEDGGASGIFDASNLAVQGGGSSNAGAVYLFTRVSASWQPLAYVKATPSALESHFGFSVAMDGATLVVGAELESTSATGSGAVYVFR